MTTWVAFLRGINVGRAKRISMADLRSLCESLGHARVRTVLNSGNVVFESRARSAAALAGPFEAALKARHGFAANTVFIRADVLRRIAHANPLGSPQNPSQFLVAFPYGEDAMAQATPLGRRAWSPDRLALTPDALYLDAASGLLESALANEFMRTTKDAFTTRNWSTVQKVLEAIEAKDKP